MKNLYITRGANICIDVENNSAKRLGTEREGIDYIYYIEEPTHIVYECGEYKKEADANPGDIVVTFYPKDFKNLMIIVNNDEWQENILVNRKKEQEEKERWAKAEANKEVMPHDDCVG